MTNIGTIHKSSTVSNGTVSSATATVGLEEK